MHTQHTFSIRHTISLLGNSQTYGLLQVDVLA